MLSVVLNSACADNCNFTTVYCITQEQMVELRDLFRNPDATEFCIVTIPTQLAIAESGRLLDSLDTQGIAVNNMVVNQVRCATAIHRNTLPVY
jgi:anion-transporting  ArsA/GET3 family ATPase